MKFNITILLLIFNISLFSQNDFKIKLNEDISKIKIGSNVFNLMSKFQINFGDNSLYLLIIIFSKFLFLLSLAIPCDLNILESS